MELDMKKGIIIYFILICSIFQGCKTKTVYVPVKEKSIEILTIRDTILNTKLDYFRDTVITPDTISFLSNRYGFTWAEAKNGKLHHSLTTWPDTLIPVSTHYIERQRIDSIPAPYPVEVTIYREKELSIWQTIRIRVGEIGIIAIIIIALLIARKKFM